MLVAISLATGGPGFPGLSQAIYSYLSHGLCPGKIKPVVEDIPDVKVKEHLLKVFLKTVCAHYCNTCRFVMQKKRMNCEIC